MKLPFILYCLTTLTWGLLAVLPSARAGVDFTVRTLEREDDGQRKTVNYVATGPDQRALIAPPNGWSLTGSPDGLASHPPDDRGGIVTLRSTSLGAEPPAFDPKGLEVYRRRALAEVPPGATDTRIVEERPEPFGLFGWKTHEFVLTWELGGQHWQGSAMFVTLPSRDTMLGTAVGPRADFTGLREGLMRLLSNWCPEPAN